MPEIGTDDPEHMSTVFSHYRTGLSHHRTELSEHRTDLSEYRTDLSGERTELSMRRTGMSFQRTRMSADRTLMSVIRTSLSLIGFGFTIAQAFEKLRDSGAIRGAGAPRNFGLALVCVGILVLIGGLVRDLAFALELRRLRRAPGRGASASRRKPLPPCRCPSSPRWPSCSWVSRRWRSSPSMRPWARRAPPVFTRYAASDRHAVLGPRPSRSKP
ncbi:MAG: DUF202 domain-containing protein [Caulobacteraceae bacterium]